MCGAKLRHKPMCAFFMLIIGLVYLDKSCANTESEVSTTVEPDASPGCKAPEIRFNVIKPESGTERPYVKFEGTQMYLPEDLTTSDVEHVEKPNGDDLHMHSGINNPYDLDMHEVDDEEEEDDDAETEGSTTKLMNVNRRLNKKRRSGSARRRRIENENGQSRGRGSRYKRHVIYHDPEASAESDKWSGGKLAAHGDVYYVRIGELLKSSSPNQDLRSKLYKLKRTAKRKSALLKKNKTVGVNQAAAPNSKKLKLKHSISKRDSRAEEDEPNANLLPHAEDASPALPCTEASVGAPATMCNNVSATVEGSAGDDRQADNATQDFGMQRVKRKSGKTTGALSRPKGGGDSSSKTTSRKDKGILDEEGGPYMPVHPDDVESEEEEDEDEEIDIQQQFTEVSEIRFPGEIGPLGDRRLCKIRCVKGKWVGPLCATNEEDDNGNVKFQPLYKSCHVNRIPPHLLLSYRNISVTPIPSIRGSRRNRTSKSTFVSNTQINVGWDLPHGHSLQARCRDLGLYKLLGESRVLCSNGLWAPRMPSCVPTTLLTNFSDDSAPSIRIKIFNGSGAFEPSGVLAVLPHSLIHLDCIYPRQKGLPEWTCSSWHTKYPTGWSTLPEEKNLRYRLTIKDIQNNDSGSFTCTSPRGLTNSVAIVVATSICPQLSEPLPPLTLRLEGNKLGQRAMYRCPAGYRIDGGQNATCLASGNWSSPPPTCQSIQCPRIIFDDQHLSLVELNTSAWGRAVFKCQWGFKLTGPPGLECLPTGVWSGQVPRCKAIQCPMPMAPLNGRIGGTNLNLHRLTVGALITFSCNEGHTLVGEQSIICTENGFWSHQPPFCKSQCPYPGDPPNGLIAPLKFNYDSGDYLSVQCRPGFIEINDNAPPERTKCLADGNWSGSVPKCIVYSEV